MRLLLSHVIFSGLFFGSASATNAQIFLSESSSSPRNSNLAQRLVDPSTARLIFASRLGLSQFHTLKDADEPTIQAVNDFGSGEQRAFGGPSEAPGSKALILVEGVENIEDIFLPTASRISFEVSGPPAPSINVQLLEDFARQAKYIEDSQAGSALYSSNGSRLLDPSLNQIKGLDHYRCLKHGDRILVHCGALESIAKRKGTSSSEYRTAAASLHRALSSLFSTAQAHDMQIILALFPISKDITGVFKRSSNPYGSFSFPNPSVNRRRQTETPSHMQANSNSSTKAPSGVLRVCYSSKSSCDSVTNSCSGHGSCALKYRYQEGDDETSCYACSCEQQTRTNDDGSKKTIRWAGPACQKKDVSVEFWLLGGFTVLFISLLSWGIGLLVSMGQETLPSVIGAGVAGVSRAK